MKRNDSRKARGLATRWRCLGQEYGATEEGGTGSKGMRSRKDWLESDSEGSQIYLKVYFVVNARS